MFFFPVSPKCVRVCYDKLCSEKARKVYTYLGVVLAVLLAVGSIIIALTITVSMSDDRQLFWGVNFLKSMLQDLFFSPIIGIVSNSLLLLISLRANCLGRSIKNTLRKCIDENFLVVFELFSKTVFKVKPSVKKVHYYL